MRTSTTLLIVQALAFSAAPVLGAEPAIVGPFRTWWPKLWFYSDPACTGAPSTEQAIGQELITKCAIMTPDRVGLGVQKDQELDPAPQGTSGCTRLYKDEGCNEDVDKKEISLVDVPYNQDEATCVPFPAGFKSYKVSVFPCSKYKDHEAYTEVKDTENVPFNDPE